MPENRKYTQAEIDYVLSRASAGWKPDLIAKCFKLDHPFWANKHFTSKQVAYIKGAHKPPPFMVNRYNGPKPTLPPSPPTDGNNNSHLRSHKSVGPYHHHQQHQPTILSIEQPTTATNDPNEEPPQCTDIDAVIDWTDPRGLWYTGTHDATCPMHPVPCTVHVRHCHLRDGMLAFADQIEAMQALDQREAVGYERGVGDHHHQQQQQYGLESTIMKPDLAMDPASSGGGEVLDTALQKTMGGVPGFFDDFNMGLHQQQPPYSYIGDQSIDHLLPFHQQPQQQHQPMVVPKQEDDGIGGGYDSADCKKRPATDYFDRPGPAKVPRLG